MTPSYLSQITIVGLCISLPIHLLLSVFMVGMFHGS